MNNWSKETARKLYRTLRGANLEKFNESTDRLAASQDANARPEALRASARLLKRVADTQSELDFVACVVEARTPNMKLSGEELNLITGGFQQVLPKPSRILDGEQEGRSPRRPCLVKTGVPDDRP